MLLKTTIKGLNSSARLGSNRFGNFHPLNHNQNRKDMIIVCRVHVKFRSKRKMDRVSPDRGVETLINKPFIENKDKIK